MLCGAGCSRGNSGMALRAAQRFSLSTSVIRLAESLSTLLELLPRTHCKLINTGARASALFECPVSREQRLNRNYQLHAAGCVLLQVPLSLHQIDFSRRQQPQYATVSSGEAEPPSLQKEEESEPENIALALQRLVLEGYSMLAKGQLEQAEKLLIEGTQSVAESLGSDSGELAPLHDQLSLLHFLQGKLAEAEQSARNSLAVISSLFRQDDPAVSICKLRLGIILQSMDRQEEAKPLLLQSQQGLQQALGEAYAGAGEAVFYTALADLASTSSADDSAVEALIDNLIQGLHQMRNTPGVGPFLVRAGLREHSRLASRALDRGDPRLAAALMRQGVELHRALNDTSSDLSLLTYQLATLQHCRGEYDDAEQWVCESLEVSAAVKESPDSALLRKLRQGTIWCGQGRLEQAEPQLVRCLEHFKKRLGARNPLTAEAQVYMALLEIKKHGLDPELLVVELDVYKKINGPSHRAAWLHQMRQGINVMMQSYGEGHVVVKKAMADYERVAAAS